MSRELDLDVAKILGWPGLAMARVVPTYSADNSDGVWEMLQWLKERAEGELEINILNDLYTVTISMQDIVVTRGTLPHALAATVLLVADTESE